MQWIANFLRRILNVQPVVLRVPAPPSVFVEPKQNQELPGIGENGLVKLGIIVGHSTNSPGAKMAAPYDSYEYFWNGDLAKKMQAYAKSMYTNMQVDIFLRDEGGITGAYDAARGALCDCAIELHFNAFNHKSSGTMTLCSPAGDDVMFAHIVQKAMVSLYKREGKDDRGVKTVSKADRGGINVHSFPGGANCLIEPFFGDNVIEAKMANEKKEALAKALVDAVILWAKKIDLIKGGQ